MPRRILHQPFRVPCRGAILAFTEDSVLIRALGEDTRSSLIRMGDGDLEGVVVEPRNQRGGAALVLLVEKPQQAVAVGEAIVWFMHDALSVTDGVV
jgi:hypothetical protein